jgi:hypothetical protein
MEKGTVSFTCARFVTPESAGGLRSLCRSRTLIFADSGAHALFSMLEIDGEG